MAAACAANVLAPVSSPIDFFYGNNDDKHWLSEDHLFELQTARDAELKAPPPLTTWKEADATEEVEVTVAKARRLLWEQGQAWKSQLHHGRMSRVFLETCGTTLTVMESTESTTTCSAQTSKLCRLFAEKAGPHFPRSILNSLSPSSSLADTR